MSRTNSAQSVRPLLWAAEEWGFSEHVASVGEIYLAQRRPYRARASNCPTSFQFKVETHGGSAVQLCFPLFGRHRAQCLTKSSSTPNAPKEKKQSERLLLSPPESCPKRNSTLRLRAVRLISAVLVLCSDTSQRAKLFRQSRRVDGHPRKS